MRSAQVLAALAARLNHDAGGPPIPSLFFFTDPLRTPGPLAAARRLPRGAAVVYRHFGAPERWRVARQLSQLCRARGLTLLIAADPGLARAVSAAGVHWPERLAALGAQERFGLTTMSAHGPAGVSAATALRADACVLAPVFPTSSGAGNRSLGLFHASQMARAAALPVIALGGINRMTAPRLLGRGFSGFGCVEALA